MNERVLSFTVRSAAATAATAEAVAETLRPGDLVVLSGAMGSGKTTFTQALGRALGVSGPITSPTFALAHAYPARVALHHLDVYRLDQLHEVIELGIDELLDDGVVVIEWGELIEPLLPADRLTVRLSFVEPPAGDDRTRRVEVAATGGSWITRWPGLSAALSGAASVAAAAEPSIEALTGAAIEAATEAPVVAATETATEAATEAAAESWR